MHWSMMNDMDLIQYTPLLPRYPWNGYTSDKVSESVVRGADKSEAGDFPETYTCIHQVMTGIPHNMPFFNPKMLQNRINWENI